MVNRIITKPQPGVQINLAHPLTKGLVGCWLFNEKAGSQLSDISGNNNHGTLTNMDPSSDWVGSLHGGSLNFNGTDGAIELGSPTSLDDITTITICAWVFADTFPNDARIYAKDDGTGANGITFMIDENSPRIQFRSGYSTTDGRWKSPENSLITDIWQHICVTFDNSTSSTEPLMYIDGVSVTVTETTGQSGSADSDASFDAVIGNRPNFGRPWDGLIDDLRIWNRILSPTEIKQLFFNPYSMFRRPDIFRYGSLVAAPAVLSNAPFYGTNF